MKIIAKIALIFIAAFIFLFGTVSTLNLITKTMNPIAFIINTIIPLCVIVLIILLIIKIDRIGKNK